MSSSGYIRFRSENPCAVIDVGSGLIKAGLEGFGRPTGAERDGAPPRTTGVPTRVLHNAVTPSNARSAVAAEAPLSIAESFAREKAKKRVRFGHSGGSDDDGYVGGSDRGGGGSAKGPRGTQCVCCELPLTHSHAASTGAWEYAQQPGRIDRPVVRGTVRDYGQLENVLYHVLRHELECYIPHTPLLLTGKFLSCYDHRDVGQLAEICFESFGHPAVAMAPPAPLVLMAR